MDKSPKRGKSCIADRDKKQWVAGEATESRC